MYKDRPEEKRALADLYWRTLLCIALAIMLLSLGYGFFALVSALRDSGNSSADLYPPPPLPSLDRVQLQSALDEFRARENQFESLKANAPTQPDPSE